MKNGWESTRSAQIGFKIILTLNFSAIRDLIGTNMIKNRRESTHFAFLARSGKRSQQGTFYEKQRAYL